MAVNIGNILNTVDVFADSATVAAQSYDITGNKLDLARAGGYAAFVKSVTGKPPYIRNVGGRVVLYLDAGQAKVLEEWIVSLSKGKGAPPSVTLDIGPALKPAIMRMAIPYIIGVFLLGYGAHYVQTKTFHKRRR